MRIGIIFPHFEFGVDPAAIRDYAQNAEELGYAHIGADDHVIGPNPNRPGGWQGWVTYRTTIHEPLVLFGFMAALTRRIELCTTVLILPQRQTVLAAKQTAQLDLLSGGRLRVGVGIGWNVIEYISLGETFTNRGRRVDEQVALLRKLWTQELVDFSSPWHTIPDAGINPLPVQRPIPIWFGGQSEAAIRRAARIGDGWMPLYSDAKKARPGLALWERELGAAGRSRAQVGLEARVPYGKGNPDEWKRLIEGWREVGATHISLVTTDCGLQGPEAHIGAMRKFAKSVGLREEYKQGIKGI
jgi:probable F420-dependent oxidoreductase